MRTRRFPWKDIFLKREGRCWGLVASVLYDHPIDPWKQWCCLKLSEYSMRDSDIVILEAVWDCRRHLKHGGHLNHALGQPWVSSNQMCCTIYVYITWNIQGDIGWDIAPLVSLRLQSYGHWMGLMSHQLITQTSPLGNGIPNNDGHTMVMWKVMVLCNVINIYWYEAGTSPWGCWTNASGGDFMLVMKPGEAHTWI